MVDVFLDKRLNDYFTSHSWGDVERDDQARDSVMNDFLTEKIAIIHGVNAQGIDLAFLGSLNFPQNWAMKKFSMKHFLGQVSAAGGDYSKIDLFDQAFGRDVGRFEYFVGQTRLLEQFVDRMISRLLGRFTGMESIIVTRFSETRMENLHYDLDAGSDDHEAFRFYINLDASPRIWSTSYQMSELCRQGGARLLDGLSADEKSETILKRMTGRAFGGWHQRATERTAPRHQVYFDPGDIWIVDGRCVSHQVLSGHRVLSTYVKIPHAGNPDLTPTFAEKIRAAFKDGIRVPVGEETAKVSYYSGKEITGPADMRGEWAEVFGETGTGRIRRFNDTGMTIA